MWEAKKEMGKWVPPLGDLQNKNISPPTGGGKVKDLPPPMGGAKIFLRPSAAFYPFAPPTHKNVVAPLIRSGLCENII